MIDITKIDVLKYIGVILLLPLLLIDTTSKLFSWLFATVIIVFGIWALRKWVFKKE